MLSLPIKRVNYLRSRNLLNIWYVELQIVSPILSLSVVRWRSIAGRYLTAYFFMTSFPLYMHYSRSLITPSTVKINLLVEQPRNFGTKRLKLDLLVLELSPTMNRTFLIDFKKVVRTNVINVLCRLALCLSFSIVANLIKTGSYPK